MKSDRGRLWMVRELPLVTVLYKQEERGDPEGWTEPPELRALIVRRTRGFGPLVLKGRTD